MKVNEYGSWADERPERVPAPKKLAAMVDGRISVCEGHTPDCFCTACSHVRHLLSGRPCDCVRLFGWKP